MTSLGLAVHWLILSLALPLFFPGIAPSGLLLTNFMLAWGNLASLAHRFVSVGLVHDIPPAGKETL